MYPRVDEPYSTVDEPDAAETGLVRLLQPAE
jgi:hypothetical protein